MKFIFRLTLIAIILQGLAFLPNQDLKAQDPRYTQYYNSPLRLNPAMTGVFEGKWRVGANFRTQWGSVMNKPYNTYNIMADMKTSVFKTDYIGVGFSALTDISGGGIYNITDVGLSISYQKKLSGGGRSYRRSPMTSYLVAGAQLGIGQRSVRWDQLTFSTQYQVDNNIYNGSAYSGENLDATRSSRIYPDLSAGLMWFATFGKRKSVYAGFSLFHFNRPEIGLINRSAGNTYGVEKLYMRIVTHVGGEYLLGKRGSLSILPGFVGMFQGPAMEINFGCGIKYQGFKYDDFAIRFAVWSRLSNMLVDNIHADAIMLMVGIDYLNFRFGVSYDINVSSLMAVSKGQGSLEFSLIYTFDGQHKREMGCPTF